MNRNASLLLSLALLGGCATTVQKGSLEVPPAAAGAAAKTGVGSALPDQQVAIPAAAKRLVVLTMTGPANVINARDWKDFKEEFRAVFAEHAKQAGIAFAMQDGDAPVADDGTLVAIVVNDYRMIGIGARIMLGVFSGNAYVDARVRFADLRTGKTFGAQTYNTSSSAWHGIFAKMTPQQVDAIAAEVFGEIKRP